MSVPLPRPASVVVFDAYGTLFDVHSAVMRHADRVGPEALRLSEIWRTKQLEYSWVSSLMDRYEPFWTLTVRALDYAFAAVPSADRGTRADLLSAYRTLSAYPEARDVLAALKAEGVPSAILSNGDPDMLAAAVESSGFREHLDAVLSVDAARIFKTHPRAYDLVGKAFGVTGADVLFVSSNRWDVAGATAYGFSAVWVNRTDRPDEYPGLDPIAVIKDLRGLPKG